HHADGAAQQVPERIRGAPLWPAGRDRHDDHDPCRDTRHADPEPPGERFQLRHDQEIDLPDPTSWLARSQDRSTPSGPQGPALPGKTMARIQIKDLVKTFGAYTAVS